MGGHGDNGMLRELAVLAVDDHPVNRAFLHAVLAPRVARLEVVESGHAAIERLRAFAPDLLVLDLHMPEFDGFSAWAEIRSMALPSLPLAVALTADHRQEIHDRARAVGFRGHVKKPIGPEALLDALERVVAGESVFEERPRQGPANALLDDEQGVAALGSPQRLTALRAAFAAELRSGLRPLEDDLWAGREAAADRLHQWVGACGYVGAVRLAEAAAALGSALNRRAGVGPAWLGFRRCAEATLAALSDPESG